MDSERTTRMVWVRSWLVSVAVFVLVPSVPDSVQTKTHDSKYGRLTRFCLLFFRLIHQYNPKPATANTIPPTNAGMATAMGKAVAFWDAADVAASDATTDTVTIESRWFSSVGVGPGIGARGKGAGVTTGSGGWGGMSLQRTGSARVGAGTTAP